MFITFEGGEGSGKTTIMKLISEWLTSKGVDIVVTREPGGTPLAEELRQCIMRYDLSSEMESYYFAVARHIHLEEKIIPSLNNNKVVLCDRYIDSSYVYQGFMKNRFTEVYWLNQDFIQPDITFYLRVDPEIGLQRVSKRNEDANRFDLQDLDYHKEILEYYDICAEKFSNRIVVIDASKTIDEIFENIKSILIQKFNI